MIRPFTCICMLLAAGSGLYLYQTKHRAQLLDREIARTLKQTDQARDRIGALKGEWALLSEPERLNELAAQHLALKTLAPTQFVAMADLGARLPAPLPPGSAVLPTDEPATTGVPVAASKPIVAAPRIADKTPDRPAEKPVQMAAMPQPPLLQLALPQASLPQPAMPPAGPAPRAAAKVAAAAPVVPAATPAPVFAPVFAPVPARPLPQPAMQPAMQPSMQPRIMAPVMNVSAGQIHAPGPGGIGESVARAARAREQAPVMIPAAAAPAPSPSPMAPAGAFSGSALGGAGRVALPAPVPFGAGQR